MLEVRRTKYAWSNHSDAANDRAAVFQDTILLFSIFEAVPLGYNELKYRQRFTTSIDKNILRAFFELANKKNQPKSWLIDEALEDFLRKNGIEVQKASLEK